MVPLNYAKAQGRYEINRVLGNNERREKLASLGFVSGESLELITLLHGNVIVAVRGSRFALNTEEAKNILLEDYDGIGA